MQEMSFQQLVDKARAAIREIDVTTVKAMQDSAEDFYLVDVREDHEWVAGHIPKAVHLSKGILERDIEARIPDYNSKIVMYCAAGSRCALAALSLQQMGYKNVFSIEGGLGAWQRAGYPIE